MSEINDLLDKFYREMEARRRRNLPPYEYEPVPFKLRTGDLLMIYRALQAMSAIRELVK